MVEDAETKTGITASLDEMQDMVEATLAYARGVGQDEALRQVARTVRRAASGLSRRGPRASLLFLGPTGTGKTELARSLAAVLGDPFELVRVDGSELSAARRMTTRADDEVMPPQTLPQASPGRIASR